MERLNGRNNDRDDSARVEERKNPSNMNLKSVGRNIVMLKQIIERGVNIGDLEACSR